MDIPCVFLDLDDTLFHSRRRLAATHPARLGPNRRLTVGAVDVNGVPNCYMRACQQTLFDWLTRSCRLIPATCRTWEQFQRSSIGEFEHAIVYCGGMIVDGGGQIHEPWRDRMIEQLSSVRDALEEAGAIAQKMFAGRAEIMIRTAQQHDSLYYLQVKDRSKTSVGHTSGGTSSHSDESEFDVLASELAADPFDRIARVMRQGSNLYLIPNCIDKRNAVEYLIQSWPSRPALTIGIGDSAIDTGFMDLCDFAMTPTSSELWDLVNKSSAGKTV